MNVLDNVFGFLKTISDTDVEEVDTAHSKSKTQKSDLTASDKNHVAIPQKTRVKKYKRSKIYYGKYKCSDCDYKSDKERYILIHKDVVHLNIKRFNCNYCTQKTYWKSNLLIHMKSFHSDKIDIINEFEEKIKKRKGKRELLFVKKINKEKLKKYIVTSKKLRKNKNYKIVK